MIDYQVLATSQHYRPLVEFWRSRVADLRTETLQRARPHARFTDRRSVPVALDEAAARVLAALATDPLGRLTVVTAALALAVSRCFHRHAVVVRTPLLDPVDGTLNDAGEVPLVFRVAPDATLKQLLGHVADIVEQSYSFQDFPVRALLADEGAPDLGSIADVSLWCPQVHPDQLASPSPLHVNVDALDRCRVTLEWDASAGEPAFADVLAAMLPVAIASFGTRDSAVRDIARVPVAQRTRLLVDWNQTSTPHADPRCVHELFEQRAAADPQAPAVVFGNETMTYGQLNASANAIARRLLDRPSPPTRGAIVGIWMDRSPAMLAAVFGVLKAGCAYLPIDAECPAGRLEFILKDAAVSRLIVDASRRTAAAAFGVPLIDAEAEVERSADAIPDPSHRADVGPTDLAYIIYTSGSTGQPKGCAIEHGSLSNYVQWAIGYYWSDPDSGTMGLFSPLSFDLTVTSLFCPLLRGRSVVVYPQTSTIEEILRHQFEPRSSIDTIKLTPSHVSILDSLRVQSTGIRVVIVGGEELTERHVETLRRINPRMRVVNEYGPTEATVGCVVKDIASGEAIAIGRPIANTRAYVLDEEQQLVPIGVRGELCISGSGLARGYHARDGLTAAKFVPHPFEPGERLYRTGDVARWLSSGELEWCGRLDDQVKIRGYRVELGEVEAALRTCDGVRDALVAVDEHEAIKELVAYIVADGVLEPSSLHRRLAARLPDYMVPTTFVAMEALPLTPNGKVDRARVPPRAAALRSSRPYVSPRGREEQALVRIWQDVFRTDGIGVDDDFFERGGHSLRAMQMVMKVQQELGVEISLNDIFRSPTIARLAAVIREAAPSSLEPIRPLPTALHYAVSHGQKRLWILNQLEENAAAYNVSSAFELLGRLDVAALERAFARLIDRHESLRTTFAIVDDEPRQRIHPSANGFALRTVDVSHAGAPEQRAQQIAAADAMGAFDLARGPLMRATLVALSSSRFVLVLTMHHIVTDEWSLGVLIEDLVELYRRERTGLVEPLAPLPIQYKDFAAWQRTALAGAAAECHRQYWLQALGGDLPALDLPADFPRRTVKTNAGRRLRFSIDAAAAAGIKSLGAANGASLFITLVAIVKVLLHRYTGQTDIRVGIPIAGRRQIELADQVGFYLNTLVLRDRLEPSQTFAAVLAAVTQTSTDAYEHDIFPLDRLVEELDASRDEGRLRLFDVLVVQGNAAPLDLHIPELAVHGFDMPVDVSKFDLSFQFEEDRGGIVVELQYDSDLFLPDRMRRMQADLETIVAKVIAAPGEPIGAIDIRAAAGVVTDPAPRKAADRGFVAPATTAELTLAAIWCDVLGIADVGVHDNFFELGGDSIIALQIVSRAARSDLRLSLKQLFRHPTIGELARLAAVGPGDPIEADTANGAVPLTPMQRSFFDLQWPEPSHFNQALLLQTPQDVDAALLSAATRHVFGHHDAFRLRAGRTADGWTQAVEPGVEPVTFDVETMPEPDRLPHRCDEIQRTLDIANGPLARVVLFDAAGGAGRMLIVVHHFAIDGLSWRILLDDLARAYGQLRRREPIALPARTLSFRGWVRRLQAWADAPAIRADAAYWLQAGTRARHMEADFTGAAGSALVATEDHVSIALDAATTTRLLTQVPRAYNSQINDALLTALAAAITRHMGRPSVQIDLESHGREEPIDGADVSRTVGWFTSTYPVTLTVPPDRQPGSTLKAVKEQLRGVPSSGLSYGLLRDMTSDQTVRAAIAALPRSAVRFNYLGQMDATFERAAWQPAPESAGASQSPGGRRPYLLDVVALVRGGRLEIDWIFSSATHRRETIAHIADAFVADLRTLVEHCTAPDAGGFTPSDFPAATLTQHDLDRLIGRMSAHGTSRRRIADIYDLTPTQEGMLFHSVLGADEGVYVDQWLFSIAGALDAAALRRAWQEVSARHAVLSTAFFWQDVAEPVQAVFTDVPMPWEELDWRGVPESERQARLRRFLEEDRRRGFALDRPPLMRGALIRLADDAHQVCWTSHHILMDGWSRSIVLQEVIAAYQQLVLPQVRTPFRSHVEQLRAQDRARADVYWRERLAGFAAPTLLPPGSPAEAPHELSAKYQTHAGTDATRELSAFARRHHLTLNTVVCAAWALVLSAASGSVDVVCGATLAGRPASLDDAESMVGLFINTLPVRFQIDPVAPLLSWLHQLQTDRVDLDQYAYSSLVDVQRFSDVPRGRALFESLVVFENFPVARAIDAGASGLAIEDVVVFEQMNYPLAFIVVPGDNLLLRVSYDGARYSARDARRILQQVQTLLDAFVREPHQPLSALLGRLGVEPAAALSAPALSGAPPVEYRARLDAGTTARLRVLASRHSVGVLDAARAIVAIAHRRYSAHEELSCVVDSTPLSRDSIAEDQSCGDVVAASGPGAAHGDAASVGARVDLHVSFTEEDEGVAVRLAGDADRFDEAALRRVHGHIGEIIRNIEASPSTTVRRTGLLPEGERTRLIETFNDTATDWGRDQTIVELFEAQAARDPDRVAVLVPAIGRDDGGARDTLTYGELNARANQLADYLARQHGVGRDVLVGVMAERSLTMVVALLAVLKAGGAYVPLDPEYPQERLAFMIADSGASVLLTHDACRGPAAQFGGSVVFVDVDWPRIVEASSASNRPVRSRGDDLAYMIYTSGSTGRPKGALNTHRGIANRLLWMQQAFGLTSDDRVLQKTPFSFDVSVWEFFWPLITGARLVVAVPGGHRDSRYLVDVIEEAGVTTIHFVPSMLQAFIDEPGVDRCRGLERVICSGEAIAPELLRRFEARLDVPLHNLYGPTEAAVDVTWWPCDASVVTTIVPIGRPIANTQLYILDRALEPLPLGFAGELFIGGTGVGRGYLNRPELTAERFVPDPFSARDDARLYRTGDLCRYRADGNIEFLGRLDHQVKLRGFRIELGEIEARLLVHPGVRECVVIVREDQPEMKRLVAYVVAGGEGELPPAALRAHLRETLPDYMVPTAIVELEALPRLPNGKLDRRSLPPPESLRGRRSNIGIVDRHPSAPAHGEPVIRHATRYLPPRTEVERTLVRAWEAVLSVAPIGVTDDYFELGGHSLLALKLMSRIQADLGRTIPLARLFAHPTVEALAADIASGAGDAADWRPLVPIRPDGTQPPIFLLPGAGGNVIYFYNLAHALAPGRPVYGLQAIGLDGITPPLTSVAEIAAHNVREIRRVQPAGPYFLAGHSFGGRVAFEMSQQLCASGDEVGLLAILDTAAPIVDPVAVGADWQDAHWLAKIAREIEEFFGVSLAVGVDELLPLGLDAQLDVVVERLRRAGWWAPGADSTPLRGYLQVYKANMQTAYVRRDAAGRIPIVLLKTTSHPAEANDTPSDLLALMQQPGWGWDAFAAGRVRVADVPGDHLSMLAEPHVADLARAIDDALTNAGC